MLTTLALAITVIPAVAFDMTPEAIPGLEILGTIIRWAVYILTFAGVMGFIITGIMLAFSPASARQSDAGANLARVFAGCAIGSAAGLFVSAII